jgi:hypothetical protein
MYPSDAAGAECLFDKLQPLSNFVGSLYTIDLYVDQANAELDAWVDLLEDLQIVGRMASHFEDEMVHLKGVQERDEGTPISPLNALAAIVAKA